MKANKLLKTLAASAMSLALMASVTVMPAMAAVDSATGVTFTKTIDMTTAPGATVPDATYTYEITAGSHVDATANSPEILAGVGTPTIGSADFGPSDTISGNKVSKTVTVNFAGVTFDHAGIYRYVIRETNPTVTGLVTGDANTLYLDVYVTNATTGGREISHYIMSTSDAAPTYAAGTQNPDYGLAKFNGDEDTYTTYTLTVTKNIEGDMADKTATFSIDVDFTGLSDGTKVTVDGAQTGTGATSGALSVNKSLADDGIMTITGIPGNAAYTVVENLSNNSGYEVTYTLDGGNSQNATEGTNEYTTANGNMGSGTHNVVVINTKNPVTPTGIVMNIAPYALMVVIAVAGVAVFMRKRVEE